MKGAPVISGEGPERTKLAAGAMVYLMEELGDARLRCEQLVRMLHEATQLVEKSAQRDQLFEVAGHLIQAIPVAAFKLQKALQAVTLAATRIDYEELKQELRPDKVKELEEVLEDVRIRQVQRRSDPLWPVLNTQGNPMNWKSNEARQATDEKQTRFEEGKPADPTKNMSPEDKAKWKAENDKNKDKFKDKDAARYSGDPVWIKARYPGTAEDGTPFRKGEEVLYWPRTKTFMVGPKAEAAYRKFQSEVEDEAFYNMGHYANKRALAWAGDVTGDISAETERLSFAIADIASYAKNGLAAARQGNRAKAVVALQGVAQTLYTLLEMEGANGSPALTVNRELMSLSRVHGHMATDEKQTRFEEGKPADPTKNMSPEDKAKWKAENDKNKDKFKNADWKADFIEAGHRNYEAIFGPNGERDPNNKEAARTVPAKDAWDSAMKAAERTYKKS